MTKISRNARFIPQVLWDTLPSATHAFHRNKTSPSKYATFNLIAHAKARGIVHIVFLMLITLACFQAIAQPIQTPHLFQRFINNRMVVLYEYPCGLPVDRSQYPWQGAISFGGPNRPPPVLFCFNLQGKNKQVMFSKSLESVPPSFIDDFRDGGPMNEFNFLSLKRLIKENEPK